MKIITGLAILCSSLGAAYAVEGYSANGFTGWTRNVIAEIYQIEYFLQVVATVVGMWFVFHGLQLFRKHHTSQGAQAEHLKNGSGSLLIGVLLICLIPAVQMVQSTLMTGAGNVDSQQAFTISDTVDKTVVTNPV